MAFGVRRNTPGGDIYACPLCAFVTTDKNSMIDHLVDAHGMKRNEAKALVEAT